MRCHYSLMPAEIIQHEHTLLPTLKMAGVGQIWVVDCLSGRHVATSEQTIQAKQVLDRNGFESGGFASVVVGHPGNALNPEDPTLDLTIPPTWRYRVDRHGKPVYFCADIEPHMVADNAAAAGRMKSLGFTQFFVDDDFRMGNWGKEIQGCFCDHCLAEFGQILGETTSRLELSRAIEHLDDPALLEEWVAFNCRKVEYAAAVLAEQCDQFGIMAMHHGDERHGLDLAAWRAKDPNMLVRVGEMYFSDEDYGKLGGKVSQLVGVLQHLSRVGRHNSFSETTIFPPRALSAANWVHKMKLTLAAGTENLFFMGGTWTIEDNYWAAEIAALPGLRRLAALAEPERRFPVHVVSGTHGSMGEAIDPPPLPFLAGLPATPVRGSQLPEGGQVLLAFGNYDLGTAWDAALPGYSAIICDEVALARNPSLVTRGATVLPVRIADDKPGTLEILRKALAQLEPGYPYVVEGRDVFLFWLGGNVLLLNLLSEDNHGVLAFGEARRAFTLAPQAIVSIPLAGQAIGEPQHIV